MQNFHCGQRNFDSVNQAQDTSIPTTLYARYFVGIFDHRWTLDSLNITESTTESTTGAINEAEGAMDGAVELTGDGKIIFQQFNSYCKNIWCYPFYTLSFWLKYEDVASQDIFAFGDLVKVTQTSSTPTDHLSIELNSPTQTCHINFFVPTEVWSHIIVAFNRDVITLYLDGRVFATNPACTQRAEDHPDVNLVAGGSGDVHFALDDVRVLFDARPLYDTVRSYKKKTGMTSLGGLFRLDLYGEQFRTYRAIQHEHSQFNLGSSSSKLDQFY